jgi:hypothetical protein|nr:MAG TPA_asm: hypothetical protein [Caudoviricetes sp.]
MDAVKFLQERARMCNSFSPNCEGCRADEEKPVMSECYLWMFENPEIAVKIVEKWSAAHPRKTRQSVFLEQYPEAEIDGDGVLDVCPTPIFHSHRMDGGGCLNAHVKCSDCRREFWMQEVE